MRLRIDHTTTYGYDTPAYALHQVRMRPADTEAQTILSWDVDLDGATCEASYSDQHGNRVDLISITPEATRISITCRGEVETKDTAGVLGLARAPAPLWLYRRVTPLTRSGTGVRKLVRELGAASRTPLETLHALMGHVADAIRYDTEPTGSATTAEEALALGHGVCQDHAHVFIAAARLLDFPARYAGGYMLMEGRTEQEAGHAWAEAWIEGLGWVGFDPANRICPDARYIQVATGLDYAEAAPISGIMYGGGKDSLSVRVQVQQQ